MADNKKVLKGINFPGLTDTYYVPEVDTTLSTAGAAADAATVGEALDARYTKTEIDEMELITVDDIDAICGTTISSASEVEF